MKFLFLLFSIPVLGQNLVPRIFPGDILINHTAYSISYSVEHKQARWDYYMLIPQRPYGKIKRKSDFHTNPKLSEAQSCQEIDYRGCPFDRGHLAPAEDMSFSNVAMKESFFLSNVSPQVVGFNRGIWKRLETQVRHWKDNGDTIHVITGGHIHKGLPKLNGNVSIPNNFYKIVITKDKHGSLKAIAFMLPNKPSKNALTKYLITIDELEALTRIDFCYKLPDPIEKKLESGKADLNFWKFN